MAHYGFGMRVIATGRRPLGDLEMSEGCSFEQIASAYGLELYTTDADAVLRQADALSIHLPATPETRHFIDARRLSLMKPGARLINTSRGPVVDEDALYDALAQGRLAGAGLDVFETEPYAPASPGKDLRALENTVLTSHIGSNTREANERMARACLDNIAKFFAGRTEEMSRGDGV